MVLGLRTVGVVGGLSYSPDGTLLAATTIGLSTTRLWNAQTGAAVGDQLTAGRTPFTDRTFVIDHFSATMWPPLSRTTPFGLPVVPDV